MKFNCIICKGQDFVEISKKTRDSQNQVVKCQTCSQIQLFPIPSHKDEVKFYNQDKQTKLLRKKTQVPTLKSLSEVDTQRRINQLAHKKSHLRLLDIGTGYGFFLEAAKDTGFKPTGLEIGRERRMIAQKVTKAPIWSFRISGPNRTRKKFHIVTLFHVLEHIADPVKLCSDLKTYLAKNGSLVIEVPNTNHYLLKIKKPYRDFFWQRAHISYFTPRTLKTVLKKAGFRKIKIMGDQRYTFLNALNWLIAGKPQLKNPSYETKKFSSINNLYKKILGEKLISDTLWIEAKV